MSDVRHSRRQAIRSIVQFAAIANPLGGQWLAFALAPRRVAPSVELQPLRAQVGRVIDAMASLGEPFGDADRVRLDQAAHMPDEAGAVDAIQRVLDGRCLLAVRINPESRVAVTRGAAPPRLVEQGRSEEHTSELQSR